MDFGYLQPPRQAFKIKKLKQDQFQIIDGKPYRKIYENVKYYDEEIHNIAAMKQYLKEKEPTKIYQDSFILKMIYLTSPPPLNRLAVYNNIKKHQEWFQNTLITSNSKKGRQILQEGVIYSFGRDVQYSPVIYVLPGRFHIDKYCLLDLYNAIYTLLQPIQRYMLIPGLNQAFNIVIDMESTQSFDLPLNSLQQIIEKVVFAYPYRLKELFFVNMQKSNQLAGGLKECLKYYNYQVKPIHINNMQQFRKYIPDEERQNKYEGNIQNLKQCWPISLATKYQQEKSYFIIQNNTETDYKSIINQLNFFETIQQHQSNCGNCCTQNKCIIY